MMLTKIYAAVWIIVAITAAILVLTGNFSALAVVAFGFITFGLIFMGMMAVLPYEVSHPKSGKSKVVSEAAIRRRPSSGIIEHAREFAGELLSSEGVEVRKPRYH